ncbi:hypothetical protein RB195_003235 [Necator americanus]|uniref:Uncharacterized protein n=1 Tax=Necator americanus TaxID=51031 RepID=A0ABR1DP50_NECAM
MERCQVSHEHLNKESGQSVTSSPRRCYATATPQQWAHFLICYWDCEKVEELDQRDLRDFNATVALLKQAFEGSQHRYTAREASVCQQQPGKLSATFADRLLNLAWLLQTKT